MKISEITGPGFDDVGQKIYKGNTTRIVNTPVADKNISVADQRMQQAGNRIKRDIANMKAGGDTVITPGNTLKNIATADKNIATAYNKQDKIDQRSGAGTSYITKGKPVKFSNNDNVKLNIQ